MSTNTENVPAVMPSGGNLAPHTFAEAVKFSELLANSSFIPKEFRGKVGDIIAAIQFGYELGVGPMQALQNIAVINGKPSVYGDLALALVQASGLLEDFHESDDGQTATCTAKRKDISRPFTATFSNADAKAAGLLGKAGPWTQYQARMRQFRARGFCLRDGFADVLKGLITREEAEDYPVRRAGAENPPAGAAEPAIDTSATQVDVTTGEVSGVTPPTELKQAPTDRITVEQREALKKAARSALGEGESEKWLGNKLREHKVQKWSDVTVAIFQALTKELVEFTRSGERQAEPVDGDDINASFEAAQATKGAE